MKQLNNESRFDRQASLQNNDKRKELKVCVVGAGWIGSNAVYCLAKQGIEHIKVIDFDIVEKFLHEVADFLTLNTYDTSKI